MSTLKKLIVAAMPIALYGFSMPASAACSTDTAGQWECLEVNGVDVTSHSGHLGPFTFQGITDLTYYLFGLPVLSATCQLTLEGTVDVDTRAYIDVVSATIVPDPNNPDPDCNNISVSGFDWHAYEVNTNNLGIPGSGDVYPNNTGYALGDFATISVHHSAFGSAAICSGRVEDVIFRNGNPITDPSSFEFNDTVGNCEIVGTLFSVGDDVNAW